MSSFSIVHYSVAIIYKTQDATDKAIKAEKNFFAARIILGDLYARQDKKEKTAREYQAVIDAAPFGIDLEPIKGKLARLQK